MKLHLPCALFRALMACFASMLAVTPATASNTCNDATTVDVRFAAPDVEQDAGMLCWAASAADILSLRTGQDAQSIYRSITEASGNTPGYVASALSWYLAGAEGKLQAQEYRAEQVAVRQGFSTVDSFASALELALGQAGAASLSLYPLNGGQGHAITVYGCEREDGRFFLSYVDSSDGVQGVRRAEVLSGGEGCLLLHGSSMALGALSFIVDDEGAADSQLERQAPVGAFMHSSPSGQGYADMAENRGVYRFGSLPSAIMYQHGEPIHLLTTTPDYAAVADMGCYTLIDDGSYQVTVHHNGMMSSTFSSRFVGSYAQHYSTIGIRGNETFVFGAHNPFAPTYDDYKLDRMSRLVTDAPSSAYCTDLDLLRNIGGTMHYRVGAGSSGRFDSSGNIVRLAGAWGYGLTAGIAVLGNGSYNEETGVNSVGSTLGHSYLTCSPDYPMPSIPQGGDSGSPIFIYNSEAERFELVGVLQGGNYYNWGTRYNATATDNIINCCEVVIATSIDFDEASADASTYYIHGAKAREGDMLVQDGEAAAYIRKGYVTLGSGTEETKIVDFNGVALDTFAQGTWKPLIDIADSATWYNYDDRHYLNASYNTATDAATFGVDDLFYTSNLQFVADAEGESAYRRIELAENVDLGIGRVQFSLGSHKGAEGETVAVSNATFDIGWNSSSYFLSSAGYVVDKGVTVNNYFTYERGRELRRTGEGVLNIVGSGNSDLLLNIGAGGLTYLNRENGYGAYSALVNTRAVLKLHDVAQVYNNVTLGAGGGIIDFNGNDFRWVSSGVREQASDGCQYFGLTVYGGLERVENSYVVNNAAGTTSTITIEMGGEFEFAGAFRDGSFYSTHVGGKEVTGDSRFTMMPSVLIDEYTQFAEAQRKDSDSVLRVVYNGHGTMTMTGVYTVLTGSNAGGESGFEVASGTVELRGTNTIHALGSESGLNHNRWQNPNDWHFAMAEMDVTVHANATFELGDHALLIGDVHVQEGGSFVMKQAVNERHEYVEGWYALEDTYELADYYGHKGNVNLEKGAAMELRFDEGISTTLNYAGNISGEGSVRVALGEGSATLSGKNTFSGTKTLESGQLRLKEGAEGDSSRNKWLVGEQGTLALEGVHNNNDVLRLVASDSSGVLALVNDFSEQLSTAYFPGLIVGAAEGETVRYGTAEQSLQSVNHQWTLGGGGGTLIVDFLLADNTDGTANKLVLGNQYGTGTVVLTNENNSFTGGIDIVGNITLEYTSVAALGGRVGVSYGNVLNAPGGEIINAGKLDAASDGVLAIDAASGVQNYNLSGHGSLSLAAKGESTLTGTLTLAEGAAYRFGGSGVMTVATQLQGDHDLVIDGQGSSGSRVVLASASTATGGVTVQGHDADKAAQAGGEVTLSFAVDNAIAAASSLTLESGATVDLNGTNQRFNALSSQQGSLITDSSQGGNTLTLAYDEDGLFEGAAQLAYTDVVKTGAGDLTFAGEKRWKSLTIAEGSVSIADGKSIGYIASGSQSIAVTVKEGATLHVTRGTSFSNDLFIAGNGDGDTHPYAVVVDSGTLNNSTSSLILEGAAAISGSFNFKSTHLEGFGLTVRNGVFGSTGVVGDGGSIILSEAAGMNELNGSDYTVRIQNGGYVSLDRYSGGASIAASLEGGSLYMGLSSDADVAANEINNSVFAGRITVGEQGGLISNHTRYDKIFHLTGGIAGTHADSTLLFGSRGDSYAREVHVDSVMDLAGNVRLQDAAVLRLNGEARIGGELSIGALATAVLCHESVIGGLSGEGTLRLDGEAALMEVSGGSFNFAGTLDVLRGTAMFDGLAGGSSQGSIGALTLGANGILAFSQVAGYTGENSALLHIGNLLVSEGGKLALSAADMETLGAGRYHLIRSESELSGFSLANTIEGSRRTFTLESVAQANGGYTLDLVVTGMRAQTFWQGTGTLIEGTAASNLTTNLTEDDRTFYTQDALTIMSAEGSTATLTLGSLIHASTLIYAGEGTVSLAQENDGMFSRASVLQMTGSGTLDLVDTTAVGGEVVMQSGTLKGQGSAINSIHNLRVTGDASLALTDSTAVDRTIDISGTLSIVAEGGGQRTLTGALAGSGILRYAGRDTLLLKGNMANFTGQVRMESGTLMLGDSKYLNLNLGTGLIRMAANTKIELNAYALRLERDIDWGNNATLHVSDGNGAAAAASGGGYNYLLTGEQRLAGQMNISYLWGKSLAIEGIISDAGGAQGSLVLTTTSSYSGGSNVTLYGENTYSGGTVINSRHLTAYGTNANSFGSGDITLTNGTLAWKNVGENWDGDLNAELVLGNGNLHTNGFDVVYSNSISGSGNLNKNGAGSLSLTGALSYTGVTNVNAGSLVLGSKLGSAAEVNVGGNSALVLQGANLNGNTVNLMGTLGGGNAVVSGTASDLSSAGSYMVAASGGNVGAGYLDITAGGELSANLTASGQGVLVLSSTEAVTLSGTAGDANKSVLALVLQGDFSISGNNTYSGGTEFAGKTLTLASEHALGTGALYAHDGSTVQLEDGVNAVIAGDSRVDVLAFGESSRVSVGAEGTAGSLTIGSTSGTAHFELDVFGRDSYDKLVGDMAEGSLFDVQLHSSTVGSYLLVDGKADKLVLNDITLGGAAWETNAYTYTWNKENGLTLTIDYNMEAINLWTGASGGSWDKSSENWNGGYTYSENIVNTLFRVSEDTVVNVSGEMYTASLITDVGKDATLTFTATGENSAIHANNALVKEGEGTLVLAGSRNEIAKVEVNGGTLVAYSAAGLGTTKVTGEGTLALEQGSFSASANDMAVANISLSNGATLDIASYSSLDGRNLLIGKDSTLRQGFWSNLNNSSITLQDGGRLVLGSVGCHNNTISVKMAGSIAVGQTTGSDSASRLDINSVIRGAGALTISDYTEKANTPYEVGLHREIANGEGASLSLIANQSNLHIYADNSYSGGTTLAGGKLTVHHANALGTGAVTLEAGTLSLAADVNLRGLTGTGGSIVGNGNDLHVVQGVNGSFSGALAGVDAFVKAGEGSLMVTNTADNAMSVGSLMVEQGSLTVNHLNIANALTMTLHAESALHIDHLTLAAGAHLIYNDTNYATIGEFSVQGDGSLTLDLDGVAALLLEAKDAHPSYDLGLNLSGVDLTVKGLESSEYSITLGENGHSFISLTDGNSLSDKYRAVTWDASWGSTWEVTVQPKMAHKAHLNDDLTLKGSSYDGGGSIDIAIDSTEGETLWNITGTSSAVVNADLWVDITAGHFDSVVMGSANGSSVDGNTHLQASGGSFNTVLGGNWGKGSFTGDSFISLEGEAKVHGLIAGASYISERNSTVSFTGNSHINIRNLQPADGEVMTQHLASDFVAGGHVVADLAGSTVRFDGHTHVGVYLDDSVTGSFSRHIVGGNVSMGGTVGSSLSHAHVGSVFLHVGNGVVFDKVVAGGHYAGNAQGRYSITGMSQLTISGGHYTNAVTAGTYIDRVSNTSEVDVLSSSLQISGGIYDGTVSGASYVRIGSDAGTTFTHADVYVRVSGGHLNKGLVGGLSLGNATAVADIGLIGMELVGGELNGPITGGVYAAASTVRSVTGTVENVDISLEGATVNGNLYGGAFLAREATNASLTVNNVGISVFAGTLNGNIYAAGAQRGASALVVGNTHVTLSLGADFAEGVVVSGGFETALGTVTGTRSLTLQGTATTIEDANGLIRVADYHNVTVRDFDRVSNAGDVSIARLEGDKVIQGISFNGVIYTYKSRIGYFLPFFLE